VVVAAPACRPSRPNLTLPPSPLPSHPNVKQHVNANLRTMYAQSDGCKAQFKNTTQYLWISEQYETGIRADWTFSCSCHGKCDCDPEGGACKNVVTLHQLRNSTQNRMIVNIDELAEFLEANFKNPTRSPILRRKAAVPCIGQDSGRVLTRTLGEYFSGGHPLSPSQHGHHQRTICRALTSVEADLSARTASAIC
jgi:hypothetical protein